MKGLALRNMAHIEGEIVINRPVEEVFDVVADERSRRRRPSGRSCCRSHPTTRATLGGPAAAFPLCVSSPSGRTKERRREDDRQYSSGKEQEPLRHSG
jgi:hypothetical protein